jgi:hypothetical protein
MAATACRTELAVPVAGGSLTVAMEITRVTTSTAAG